MSGKKYQIFISSTYKDLVDARETVTKAILNMYQIPIGMEMFSADNNEQWDTIKTTIENSDYYILIIGHRYGSVTKEGISFTEKEHDYAKELGIPILTFIQNRNASTTSDQRDKEISKQKKLETFISKVSSDAMIDFWGNQSELALKIALALTKAFAKYNRIGWIRANEGMSPNVIEEMAVLSKENRYLKDRLDEFQSRRPKFDILLNNQRPLSLKFIEDVELIQNSKLYLKEITDANIPNDVKKFVNQERLNYYNRTIRENGMEIVLYNERIVTYERYKQASFPVVIALKNTGTSKANNVIVQIRFPENIHISADENQFPTVDFTKPQYLPNNPIDDARLEWRRRREMTSSGIFLSDFPNYEVENVSIGEQNYIIEGNLLRLKFNHILHTQTEYISNSILLTPFGPGRYAFHVEIICEEFNETSVSQLDISVD